MSTAQSENVVSLPSNAYATLPAVVFKALSEFAKDTGGRPQLGFIAFCDGAAWATDGHMLMRWELEDPTGFEPGKAYTVRPVKLPAGAERVTVEFLAGAPHPLLAVDLKAGSSASFSSEACELNYPNIQAVYDSALNNESGTLGQGIAFNAAYVAFLSKHAAAVQKVTIDGKTPWLRPKLSGSSATFWDCQDRRLTFVLMPMRC
jgi:hypothetical protein